MRADNTAHLVTAARARRQRTHAKAVDALREIDAAGTPVTFEVVARAAGVSRSWLYGQPDLRAEVQRLRDARRRAPNQPVPARQRTSDASLLQRLQIANARNSQLAEENRQLRQQLSRVLGEARAERSQHPTGPQTRSPVRSSASIGPCSSQTGSVEARLRPPPVQRHARTRNDLPGTPRPDRAHLYNTVLNASPQLTATIISRTQDNDHL